MLIPRRLSKAGTTGVVLIVIGLVVMFNGVLVGPAGATGEYTTVHLTAPADGSGANYSWDYTFHQNGGHGLSNIAVRFCDDILSHVLPSDDYEIFTSGDVPGGHTGFGPGIKFAYTATTGSLTVLLDQVFPVDPAGIEVQSHSGDGQDGDLIVSGPGPGPCEAPTTTTTIPDLTTTVPQTTTTVPQTTTTVPETTTTVPQTTTTVPQTTTTVPQTTTTVPQTTTTAPAPTTTVVATTVPFAQVLGETLRADTGATTPAVVAGDQLATTGSNWVPVLTWSGLALILMGLNVMLIDYLRQRRATA